MASAETVQFIYEIRSPELADDELYGLVEEAGDELLRELQEVVAAELPGAEVRIEIARGSILVILIIAASHYVINQGGAAIVGAAVLAVATKGAKAIKKVLSRRKPQSAAPSTPAPPVQVTVNVYVRADPTQDGRVNQRLSDALMDALAGLDDDALEDALEDFPPEQRDWIREQVKRRRGMGQGRTEPVPV